MEKSKSEVILYSGGMDSHIAWEMLARPDAVYVNLGHRYAVEELQVAVELNPFLKVVEAFAVGAHEQADATIPMRNLFLVMHAALLGYDKVWLAVQKDEMDIPDRRPEFFHLASAVITMLMGKPVEVATPLGDVDKVAMVRWYVATRLDVSALKRTWACYTPKGGAPCANCPACFRRFVSMTLNDIEEPWHRQAKTSPIAALYLQRALTNYYSAKRNAHILKALDHEA